jgi:hypothetical protein
MSTEEAGEEGGEGEVEGGKREGQGRWSRDGGHDVSDTAYFFVFFW